MSTKAKRTRRPSTVTAGRPRDPERVCVGCGERAGQATLSRVVRATDGAIRLDHSPRGRAAGRGAYVHPSADCWETALERGLAHALRTRLTDEDRGTLSAHAAQLDGSASQTNAIEPAESGAA